MKKNVKQRYNIMLNPAVVERIDHHAQELSMSRSEVINFILYDCVSNFEGVPVASELKLDGQVVFPEVVA